MQHSVSHVMPHSVAQHYKIKTEHHKLINNGVQALHFKLAPFILCCCFLPIALHTATCSVGNADILLYLIIRANMTHSPRRYLGLALILHFIQ